MVLKNCMALLGMMALCFLVACGPKPVKPESAMDSPEHHVSTGYRMLKSGEIDKALNAFNRAKDLDPKFAPAYVGLSLANATQGNYKAAEKLMEDADKYAKSNQDRKSVHVGFIRLYTMGQDTLDKNWIDKAKKHFDRARKLSKNDPEIHYYMAMAYRTAFKFPEASSEFARVLEINTRFVAEADKEFAVLQKISRAMPGTLVGKKIALLPQINRADVAALFIEELKLDELFKKRTRKAFDTGFQSPEKGFVTGAYVKAPVMTDIESHVLKYDIEEVVKLGIKGLEAFPDHKFYPDKTITRAEYALMIEDILIKITGDEKLATQFIGSESPFPDLRNDHMAFNAAMVVTSRGLMQTKDIETAEFDPLGVISGADALLSIRALKTQIRRLY